jgi:hypothetical protein
VILYKIARKVLELWGLFRKYQKSIPEETSAKILYRLEKGQLELKEPRRRLRNPSQRTAGRHIIPYKTSQSLEFHVKKDNKVAYV